VCSVKSRDFTASSCTQLSVRRTSARPSSPVHLITACPPHHRFIEFVLRLLPTFADNAHLLDWNENVLNSTGPTFLSTAVRLYKDRQTSCTEGDCLDDLLVAPSDWFTPTFDPVHTSRFQTLCLLRGKASRRPDACDDVSRNKPRTDSYTTHH